MDIHVDSGATMDAIVEIKATNWDRMTLSAVRRNVRRGVRHRAQHARVRPAAAELGQLQAAARGRRPARLAAFGRDRPTVVD